MDMPSELYPELTRTIEASGDPIFVVGDHWDILLWNKAAEDTFGRPAAEVTGRPCYEVICGIDENGREVCRNRCEKWALVRRGARVRNFDIRALPTHQRWANVAIMPVTNEAGHPFALIHLLRSIDRNKRLERFVKEFSLAAEDALDPAVSNGNGGGHAPEPVHLTSRELEVLGLLVRGVSTDQIAERLAVSRHTVRNHIAVLLSKLGVHSRAEAVAYAFEHHLA